MIISTPYPEDANQNTSSSPSTLHTSVTQTAPKCCSRARTRYRQEVEPLQRKGDKESDAVLTIDSSPDAKDTCEDRCCFIITSGIIASMSWKCKVFAETDSLAPNDKLVELWDSSSDMVVSTLVIKFVIGAETVLICTVVLSTEFCKRSRLSKNKIEKNSNIYYGLFQGSQHWHEKSAGP